MDNLVVQSELRGDQTVSPDSDKIGYQSNQQVERSKSTESKNQGYENSKSLLRHQHHLL